MIFHKHNFIETKQGDIYCSCGKIKVFQCRHKWTIHSERKIELWGKTQTQQIVVCKECGDFKNINATTGQIGLEI